jgi:hypothetical protein
VEAARVRGDRGFERVLGRGGVLWWRRDWPNLWGPRPTAALPVASLATSAMIVYRFATARPISDVGTR